MDAVAVKLTLSPTESRISGDLAFENADLRVQRHTQGGKR
jgi:hypothetical protein